MSDDSDMPTTRETPGDTGAERRPTEGDTEPSGDRSTNRGRAADADDADQHDATRPSAGVAVDDQPAAPERSRWERIRQTDKVQLGIVIMIGFMLLVFARGISLGVTGEDRYELGKNIESVEPIPDSEQVASRPTIRVDLATGFTGRLIIDGTPIETVNIEDLRVEPGQQIELPPVTIYEPGNATLTFEVNESSSIARLAPGLHEATVVYWKQTENETRARRYSWTFRVI